MQNTFLETFYAKNCIVLLNSMFYNLSPNYQILMKTKYNLHFKCTMLKIIQ